MGSFFKSFGKGVLYILTLPVVLVVLVFYAAIGLVTFLFLMIKSVVLFFKGKTIFSELPEDIKAREILNPTPKDEVDVIEPEENVLPSAFTQTYFQGPTTSYPTVEEQEVDEIDLKEDIPELETPQEIVQEQIEEEQYEDPFLDEPDGIEIKEESEDLDLDHFDLGSRRIIKDDE